MTRDGMEEITGSIRLALQAKNKFDKYIFIEKNADYAAELQHIINDEFSMLKPIIEIYNSDCNGKLSEICNDNNMWRNSRAVLFLDPYATEVKWSTLEAISNTEAIDLWYLFPFSAMQRMLPNKGVVEGWKNKLNDLFGDTEWELRFYKKVKRLQKTIF